MNFDPFGDFETEGYLQNSLKLKKKPAFQG